MNMCVVCGELVPLGCCNCGPNQSLVNLSDPLRKEIYRLLFGEYIKSMSQAKVAADKIVEDILEGLDEKRL